MEKGVLFFTLALVCFWLILDDFYGNNRLTKIAERITPDVRTPFDDTVSKITEKADEVKEDYENKKKIADVFKNPKFYEKVIEKSKEDYKNKEKIAGVFRNPKNWKRLLEAALGGGKK